MHPIVYGITAFTVAALQTLKTLKHVCKLILVKNEVKKNQELDLLNPASHSMRLPSNAVSAVLFTLE